MLGKLIGYDNRIQSKFFGGVYAVMGVLAGIAAVLKALNEHFNHVIVLQYAYQIAWVICRAAAIAVIVGSIIYVIALFRNNLLKDEGYFMHTLPVPAWQLYVSKLVTGTVWIVVSIVVVILAYMLGSLDFHLPILEILRDSGVEELKIVWLAGIAIFLSIPAALMLGLLLGLFNGALVAFAGLPPFIVTLGTYTALRGAAYLLADGTTVINSDISFEWIGNDYLGPVPWLVVIALAVIAVCWFILRRTTLGVHIYAVGGNMQAARLTGIKVWLVLLFVYGMSGLLSGLGGVMSASRLYSANGNLGVGYELDAIAAVILGGTSFVGGIGTITGTLVGALIIATLNNGMTLMGVSYFWQLVIKGAVIIIAVLIDKYRTRHHQSA